MCYPFGWITEENSLKFSCDSQLSDNQRHSADSQFSGDFAVYIYIHTWNLDSGTTAWAVLQNAYCWELIISAADYISWRCVSGPGPCIYPVAALILLYHLFMYSESRWFDICLGCSFLFSRTVRAHCSPQFFYRELRWAVLLISFLKNNNSLTYAQSIL